MDETFLLRISLFVAVLGISFLFLISSQIELNDTTIEKITSGDVDSMVTVSGVVKTIRHTNATTFITLTQASDIDVVIFSNNIALAAGDAVKITGKTQDYKGKKELIADKILIK